MTNTEAKKTKKIPKKDNKKPFKKLSKGMIIWLVLAAIQLLIFGIVAIRKIGDVADGQNPMVLLIAFTPVVLIILSIVSLLTGRGTRWFTIITHGALGTVMILMSLSIASQFAKQGIGFPIYGLPFVFSALYFGMSKRIKERFEYYEQLHKKSK